MLMSSYSDRFAMERHRIERETDKFNLEREREKISSTKTAPLRAKGSNNVTLLVPSLFMHYAM